MQHFKFHVNRTIKFITDYSAFRLKEIPDIRDRRIYRIKTVERNQIYLIHAKKCRLYGMAFACKRYEIRNSSLSNCYNALKDSVIISRG